MDQSWRFRPVQGNMTNICPTCSISHFPFCPQPPAFNRNAFPLENDYAFHRPFFDNRGPPEVPRSLLRSDYRFNPMISVPRNTNDVYGDSQNWYRDQNLRIDSFRQFPQPSEMVDSASGNGFRGDGFQPPVINPGSDLFLKGEPDEMGRFSKRMKIEERSFTHMPPSVRGDYCLNLSNTSRMSSEDERRLSLVRDHGGQPSTLQSQRVTDSLGGTSLAIGHKQNGFYNGISLQQRNLKYADAAGKANFDDSEIIRTDMPLKLQDNIRAEHLHRELGGYGQQHVQSKRSGFGSDSGHTFFQNREGGMGAFLDSQYEERLRPHGQTENLLHPSMQTIGHTYIPRSGPNFLKSDQRNQDSEVLHGREEYWHKMDGGDGPLAASQSGNLNQYSHMSRDVPLHISEGSNEMYHAANLQKYQPKDTVPANDLIYPGMTNWQGSSQSNALHHEQRSSWTEHCAPNSQLPQPYTRQQPFQNSHDHFHAQKNDTRQSFEQKPESVNEIQGSVGPCKNQRDYITVPAVTSMGSTNLDQVQISRAFGAQPPLPPLTLPHIVDPTGQPASDLQVTSSLPVVSSLLFPIPATSWTTVPLSHSHTPEGQPSSQAYFHNKPSNGFTLEGSQIVLETSSTKYLKGQNFPAGNISSDKPKIIDASHIFKKPYRDNRPDHIVIILRGLPGSGKSYLAKMLRDLEVENGGAAPRIHSMDDYFMTEVEKVEESEGSSSLVKGKKAITKRVMEYCYEPEMEEAYRSSMLKAFKKNLEEGIFTCIIVDDRNLRVADFAQFWAIAKRSGYEAYLLEATYKDPVGCAARNVHGFNQDDIQKMALQWEEAPPLYLKLDIQSLFHGDELNEHGIQEVDMDMEDEACDEGLSELPDRKCDRVVEPAGGDHESVGSLKNIEGWNAEGDDPEVKELGRSKWSDDLDEAVRTPENSKGNSNALSGLIQAYGRGGKSVHWGDKAGKTGFSIGAVKAANMSLVIGPGAGYNLKSNPLPEEEDAGAVEMGGESKKRSMFQEQLRAERESFRAIFDRRRRQRIGGLEVEDE